MADILGYQPKDGERVRVVAAVDYDPDEYLGHTGIARWEGEGMLWIEWDAPYRHALRDDEWVMVTAVLFTGRGSVTLEADANE